jgi:uncharacterized protein YgbK (DUF1537 family)
LKEYRKEGGITVLVVGTRSDHTASQMKKMLFLGGASLIKIPTNSVIQGNVEKVMDEAIGQARIHIGQGSELIAVSVSSIFENDFVGTLKQSAEEIEQAQMIVKALGGIVKEIYKEFEIKSIIATGGDTSMQICKSLEADGIELIDEIAPGIPIGKIIGGLADGLLIVTKSGGFGSDNVFSTITEYLERFSIKGAV